MELIGSGSALTSVEYDYGISVAVQAGDRLDLWLWAFARSVNGYSVFVGPVPALQSLRAKTGLSPADFDLIELNEAFAAQVLACHRQMPLPLERVNVNGGSIALGHPIGATGARIVVTLLHEMRRRKSQRGLATLCISGGMGLATAFHAQAA